MEHEFEDSEALAKHLAGLVDVCEQHAERQKADRDKALNYYDGRMNDLQAEAGRSSTVSSDVRATIKKLMPSIMRTLLTGGRLVEYEPVGPGDEEQAEQATDYVNHVVVPDCGAEQALHDAIFDALVVKTGILKWSAVTQQNVSIHHYSGQSESSLMAVAAMEDGEVVDLEQYDAQGPDGAPVPLYNFTLRRTEERTDVRLEAVPRGSFLVFPDAKAIDDSPIVGERLIITRSELASRGFDKDAVYGLAAYDSKADDFDDAQARTGDDWFSDSGKQATARAMEQVLIYELYVRLDLDRDGIAERYQVFMGEAKGRDDQGDERHAILSIEPVSEAPYAAVRAERTAHEFEGRSIAEDVIDIQRVKTSLLRETMDNIYRQNVPQMAIDPSRLTEDGIEAVYNPALGKPITLKAGAAVQEAVQWSHVPFVGDKSFSMLDYFDTAIRDRTGISDLSGGLAPEAFQNMTATSAQIMSESGIAQADMIVRSLAQGGIKAAFRGLLGLIIAHADQPRTVRLRGEWREYDPRYWNADMDCTVNVGLGAGSRERDMSILQVILGLQRELFSALGPDNPMVAPEQLYNTLEKLTEAAGFPSAEPYFTRPDPQDVQRRLEEAKGPSPEEMKAQLQMQMEQAKAQSRAQVEQAQMQADLQVKQAELEKDAQIEAMKTQHALETEQLKAQTQRDIAAQKQAFERDKLDQQMALEWAKLRASEQQAAKEGGELAAGFGEKLLGTE